MKANYDDIKVRVEKGRREAIKAHADSKGESINAFINRTIDNQMERDNIAAPADAVTDEKEDA